MQEAKINPNGLEPSKHQSRHQPCEANARQCNLDHSRSSYYLYLGIGGGLADAVMCISILSERHWWYDETYTLPSGV